MLDIILGVISGFLRSSSGSSACYLFLLNCIPAYVITDFIVGQGCQKRIWIYRFKKYRLLEKVGIPTTLAAL